MEFLYLKNIHEYFFAYTQLNVKTVHFQTIQFQCQKQFNFNQFSSSYKTDPFQTIQFNISEQFKC